MPDSKPHKVRRVLVVILPALAVLAWAVYSMRPPCDRDLPPLGFSGESPVFHLALIPDTQWAINRWPYLVSEMTRWVGENRNSLNIRHLLHVGDMVQNSQSDREWRDFDSAIRVIEGEVPYALAVGNHDFESPDQAKRATGFNALFPAERFTEQPTFVDSFPPGKMNNSFYRFRGGGLEWLILSLVYNPSRAELDWANRVLHDHPGHRVIVLTHSYLDRLGLNAQGAHLWDSLIAHHPNVVLVLSGHESTTHGSHRGVAGNTVQALQFNWQTSRDPHPNSYLVVLRIDTATGALSYRHYSPHLDRCRAGDEYGHFHHPLLLATGAGSHPPPWHRNRAVSDSS